MLGLNNAVTQANNFMETLLPSNLLKNMVPRSMSTMNPFFVSAVANSKILLPIKIFPLTFL